MKRRFTILTAALALLTFLAVPMGMWGQTKITDYSSIVSGKTYYIGATTGGTDYYLYVYHDYNSSSTAGTAKTSMNDASTFVFEGSGTSWTVKFDNGKYLSLKDTKDNGKVQVVADPATFTTSNQSGKIRLSKGNYSVQKNSSTTNFGSYANTQTDIWLMEVPSGLTLTTVTIDASGITNTDVHTSTTAGSLSATVTENTNNTVISGATVTWSSSNEAVATIANDGSVTLVAEGTTTITAYYAGVNGEFGESSATYELNVSDSTPFAGGDVTFVAGIDLGSTTSNADGDQMTKKVVTVSSTSAAFATAEYRLYSGSETTISTSFGTITQIEFTKNGNYSLGNLSTETGNYTSTTGIWTGDAQEVTFIAAAQVRLDQINVTVSVPAATPSVIVTPSTINAPFAGAEGTLALNYENIDEFISFDYYFCDANGNQLEDTDPDYPGDWIYAQINDENEAYTLSYIIDANDGAARTAYMKVYTLDDNLEEVYAIVTVSQAQYVVDYATLPFEFDDGKAAIDNTNGLTQNGLGSDYSSKPKLKFDSTNDYVILKINERPGTLTFDIQGHSFSGSTFTVQTSEDGETYTNLANYTYFGNDNTLNEEFDNLGENVRYIKWVYTNKSSGNVGLGNITLAEYVAPALVASITVNPDEVNVDATPAAGEDFIEGTLDLTWENLEITDFFEDFAIQYYDAEGEELADDPNWIMVDLATQDPNIGEGYLVSYMIEENEGTEARTAYFKVFALGDEDYVYSNLVTITQAAPVAPATGDEYALYTGELVEGDYLIVYDGGAMNTTVESDRLQYEDVTVNNDVIVTDNAEIVWHIAPSGQYWTIYNADANAYAASTGAKNKAQMLTDGTDDKALWTVSLSGTEIYEFVNKQNTTNNVNANLRKNGTYGFACYATGTGGALSLYKKVEATPATQSYELPIIGYGNDDAVKTGWYLISSPIGTVAPADVQNLISTDPNGGYDLYLFDQKGDSDGNEWINYKDQNDGGFYLEPGKGYLYANSGTVNLTFTGVPYNQTGTFDLYYYTSNSDETMHGWNLVGNPFPSNATVSMPFHKINSTSDGINGKPVGAGGVIGKMEGAFVQATATEQQVTFTQTDSEPSEIRGINIDVIRNGEFLDRAIVSFTTNGSLSKLVLSDNTTKVYFRQEEKDYAIIASPSENEMPVNFKASRNGNYTLTVNAEDLEMNYLHLIDNMTGNDVDLLQTPSYSFDAKTTDYKSRFKLVFSANGIEENAATTAFAFFNGSEWTINNDGQATLQLIDLTGRTISHEVINGTVSKAINAVPGIYMLRLVSDNEVKTQKIVVK